MSTVTKEALLATAGECRSFKEMSDKLYITPTDLSRFARQFEIYKQLRDIFKANRLINPKWIKIIHTRESVLELARKSCSLSDIGKHLNVTRERARQIVEKLGINNEVLEIFDLNSYGMKMPEDVSGIFALYFQNDPENKKFFGYGHKIRRTVQGYYSWLKRSGETNHPLIQANKKYGLENFKWETIKECSPSQLKKEAQQIVIENLKHGMNSKMVYRTKRSIKMKIKERNKRVYESRKPKKSKYPGVYYHRLSNSCVALPADPKIKKQKYLGHYPDEEKAHDAIVEWQKKSQLP